MRKLADMCKLTDTKAHDDLVNSVTKTLQLTLSHALCKAHLCKLPNTKAHVYMWDNLYQGTKSVS